MPATFVPFCDKGHSGDDGDYVPWVVEGMLTTAPWSSPAQAGKGTTGLLMSDITLFDPTVSETLRLLDDLSELAYGYNAARDSYEDDGAATLA